MNLQQANDYTRKLLKTNWKQWVHEGTMPAETNHSKSANVLKGELSSHCAMCLNLNRCCFIKEKICRNNKHFFYLNKLIKYDIALFLNTFT